LGDALLLIEGPIQIAIVLVIALILFGPEKLPEIGKQLGSALRELRKATGEVARSFNTDYDPDPEPYHYSDTARSSYYTSSLPSPEYNPGPDLTDYTIAGMPPRDAEMPPVAPAPSVDDYTIPGLGPVPSASSNSGEPVAAGADGGGPSSERPS